MRLPDGNGGWVDGNGNRGKINEDGSIPTPFAPQMQVVKFTLEELADGKGLANIDKAGLETLLKGLARDMIPLVKSRDNVNEFKEVHKKQQDHDLNYLKELKKIHRGTNWSNIFFGSTFLLLSVIQLIQSLK